MTFIQTIKAKVLPLFFFCLAIYTMVTLVQSALEVSRKTLKLSTEPPNSRCVPFFDEVVEWHDNNNDSIVLYDYMAGEAIARICTNVPREQVTAAIGADHAYTPFAQQGCPLSQWRPRIGDAGNTGCTLVNAPSGTTCNDVLNWAPCNQSCIGQPYCCQGWGFAWDVQVVYNYTNTSVNPPQTMVPCHMRFEKLDGLPECTKSWVGIFHTKSKSLEAFLWAVVAVPFIVLAAQCYMLYKFDPAPPFDDDYYVSFAMRGIPGPIYQVYWVFIAKRGKFPAAKLTLATWLACAFQDAIEGLAAPIVAMYGCHLSRFPLPLALLIMKVIKFLVDTFLYFKDDDTNDDAVADGIKVPPSDPNFAAAGYAPQGGQTQYQAMYNGQQQQQASPVVSNPQGGTQYTSTTEV